MLNDHWLVDVIDPFRWLSRSSLVENEHATKPDIRRLILGRLATITANQARKLSGVPVTTLGKLATRASGAGGTWQMGCATLSKDMRPGRRHRSCAQCVLEDREREAGRLASRAYRRAWWTIRGIEGCPVHGCRLTEVAVDAAEDSHDFPQFVNANLRLIEDAAAASVPSRQPRLDAYLRERVFLVGGDGILGRLDAHVAAEFTRYLGDFLVLHDIKAWTHNETDLREWGFNLAVAGGR